MKYTYNILNIPDRKIDFSILTKWLAEQEPGEYEVTITKVDE